eukprot:1091920-Pelagomonas_calceolata.AAC.2
MAENLDWRVVAVGTAQQMQRSRRNHKAWPYCSRCNIVEFICGWYAVLLKEWQNFPAGGLLSYKHGTYRTSDVLNCHNSRFSCLLIFTSC